MNSLVYKKFEKVCSELQNINSVLEVGAPPPKNKAACLLRMAMLKSTKVKIGVNLKGPYYYKDIKVLKGNANKLEFENDLFDLVLSNATLEHDPYFWKTAAEMRRVLKPGGFIVVGVPGFAELPSGVSVPDKSTLTFEVHEAPGDYYRFSAQAMEEVIFAGMKNIRVISFMIPPRLIGIAKKPKQ